MSRKKNQEIIEDENDPLFDITNFDEEEPDEEESNIELPDPAGDQPFDDNDETPADSMGLAHQISKESATVKNFKELPREVKYSFLDNEEKREVKHFANAYRDWKYIEKIIDMRSSEDESAVDNRQNLVEIKDLDSLKKYVEGIGRHYLVSDIEDLAPEDLQKLVKHVKNLKENKFLKSMETKKTNLKEIYTKYNADNKTPKYIDDMGNISKIVNTSVASMGYKGNAAKHSVMTIQAVRNEDIQKVAEEKASFSFVDAFKKRFG